ncbi:MAG: FAD-dependent oxidoreductase [bacterium]|nr:MAG: FAD-dependent oxidoreductase [bacterium]
MSYSQDKTIVIIGAGIAGISAALHTLDYNLKPILIDRNRHLGGRVRSFLANDIGQPLDNGQHILASAYKETRHLLKRIGSSDRVLFQERFEARFITGPGKEFQFRTYRLPSPLHFLLPLLKKKNVANIHWRDFWQIFNHSDLLGQDRFKDMTVEEWINITGQSQSMTELLWKPLALSILNTPIHTASAYLLYQAISRSFLGPYKMSGMGIPLDWLSEIFSGPAERYLKDHQAEIRLLTPVNKIIRQNDQVFRVVTPGETFTSKWIISCLPPYALHTLLESCVLPDLNSLKKNLARFEYNPIMTVNIFLDKPLPGNFPASLVASPIQWIFCHPSTDLSQHQYGYALVSSASNAYSESSREEVLEMVQAELERMFQIDFHNTYRILAYKIIKEKRATISQSPEALEIRPGPVTPVPKFILAGDWTDTGLPATIESAALSGRLAVKAVVEASQQP